MDWDNILSRIKGLYEFMLKENGCIIFISGFEDDIFFVCSKYLIGDWQDVEYSYVSVGEKYIERQLQCIGKIKEDLVRELRRRNVIVVVEFCDDNFEEYILVYGLDKVGFYFYGINFNFFEFFIYFLQFVQKFVEDWGFVKMGFIMIDDIKEVKVFFEEVVEIGVYDGCDVEGFVICCKMSYDFMK